jgi:hypothetical protein
VSTVAVQMDNDDIVASCQHVPQHLVALVPSCRWPSFRLHGRAR